MRSEQWDRLRRRAETEKAAAIAEGRPHPFDETMPWDHVLKLATGDAEFWQEELVQKAILFATHLQSAAQLTDPGHGVATLGGGGGGGGGRAPKRKRENRGDKSTSEGAKNGGGKGKAGDKGKNGKAKGKGKWHAKTAEGKEICFAWNKTPDGCDSKCPNGRAHVCEYCFGSHRGCEHQGK